MSTSYHYLKAPVTSLHVDSDDGGIWLDVFLNHQKSGSLRLRLEELSAVLELFRGEVATTVFCEGQGMVSCTRHVPPDVQLLDEYGELVFGKNILSP